MQNPPTIRIGGISTKSQYQYTLQDLDLDELQTCSTRLTDALAKAPGFVDVTSDLQLSTPAVNVAIDRDRAAALGVTPQQIETALGAAYGGEQVSHDLCLVGHVSGDPRTAAAISGRTVALSRLYVTARTARWCR